MGIQTSTSDLVASRFGNKSLSVTGEQRSDDHDRSPKTCCTFAVILAVQVVEVDLFGLERIGAFVDLLDGYPHLFKKFDQLEDVDNSRYVVDGYLFGR